MKHLLGGVLYFSAVLLMSYYLIDLRLIQSVQMASLMTIIHILMGFLDRYYKRKTDIR